MFLTVWKKLSDVSPPYPQKPLDSLPQEFPVTFLRVRESMDICWFLSLEKQIHYFMPGCVSFRYKGKKFFYFFLFTMVYSLTAENLAETKAFKDKKYEV